MKHLESHIAACGGGNSRRVHLSRTRRTSASSREGHLTIQFHSNFIEGFLLRLKFILAECILAKSSRSKSRAIVATGTSTGTAAIAATAVTGTAAMGTGVTGAGTAVGAATGIDGIIGTR